MNQPNVIFAGTPDFAVASLAALVDVGIVPTLVLTQPDRRAGRGKKLKPGPVKQYALEHDLAVSQPATLRDPLAADALREHAPDLLIVAAYGLLLPQAILDIPAVDSVNVHASLLPRWRGAAPIQAAILAGDEQTGICLMRMEAGLDTGPVFARAALDIGAHETAGELHDRLALLGGDLLVTHLGDIAARNLTPQAQQEAAVTYAGKISSADAQLDWTQPAAQLERKVRAYNPHPGAWFMLGDERLKCWQAQLQGETSAPPGTVLAAGPDGIDVACNDAVLRLTRLQRPGKRPVSAGELATQLDLVGRTL